jgi:uracil-DNA glycosylase
MEISISGFIDTLAASPVPNGLCNQYALAGGTANQIRRANLECYLRQMRIVGPRVALVGEAAGHRGCRLTGIPFTSERLLLRGSDKHDLLGEGNGYCRANERGRVVGEQSATIVWSAVEQMARPPLLWNALPFHPHRSGDRWSNRTPTPAELMLGIRHLVAILDLFAIDSVIAVGNKAAHTLTQVGVSYRKVRHPAHGGKRAFLDGVLALVT